MSNKQTQQLQNEQDITLIREEKTRDMINKSGVYDPATMGLVKALHGSIRKWFRVYIDNQKECRRKSVIYLDFFNVIQRRHNGLLESGVEGLDDPVEVIPYIAADTIVKVLSQEGRQDLYKINNTFIKTLLRTYNMRHYLVEANSEVLFEKACLFFLRAVSEVSNILEKHKPDAVYPLSISLNVDEKQKATLRNERIIENKKHYEPMVCQPLAHNDLISPKGGYLFTSSPLSKNGVTNREYLKDFNKKTNPEFFDWINRQQSYSYQVNKTFLDWLKKDGRFIDDIDYDELTFSQEYQSLFGTLSPKITSLKTTVSKQKNLVYTSSIGDKKFATELVKRDYSEDTLQSPTKMELVSVFEDMERNKEILTSLEDEMVELRSMKSKKTALKATYDTITKYADEDNIYFPMFLGDNGRVYYYCSQFNPQGNNLAKSMIHQAKKEKLTESGFEALKVALGTMFDGYDKLVLEMRVKAVEDAHKDIISFIEGKDEGDKFLSLVDKDEKWCAMALALEYYNYHTTSDYETGVIVYVDATSSAIQCQALLQHCDLCADLTNLKGKANIHNNKSLPDAYNNVMNNMKSTAQAFTTFSDVEIGLMVQCAMNNKI